MTARITEICLDPQRRADMRRRGSNGIDYVDAGENDPTLTVYFLAAAPQNLQLANIVIDAAAAGQGVRVLEVRLTSANDPEQDDSMNLLLDRRGGRGRYTLRLVELDDQGEPTNKPLRGLDPRYAKLDFRFDTGVTTDVDCKQTQACAPSPVAAPDINYLAKDYGSFRQLILDRLALVMPKWQEQHVPDIGITLVEILAYAADYLSYYQDAVATEAYLNTARQRISVRRHVRLLDYFMHEGCNARAWVVLHAGQISITIDPGDLYFVAGYEGFPPAAALSASDVSAIPSGAYLTFEAAATGLVSLYSAHNQIRFYSWGDEQCCLPAGATSATLRDRWEQALASPQAGAQQTEPGPSRRRRSTSVQAVQPLQNATTQDRGRTQTQPARNLHLKAGDLLLLKEVIGPGTGSVDDADPNHQQFVRLTKVTAGEDSLCDPAVPVLEVEWAAADALTFSLCLSAVGAAEEGCQPLADVSVAFGNVLLVDEGAWTLSEPLGTVPLAAARKTCDSVNHPADVEISAGKFTPALGNPFLTFRQPPDFTQAAADTLTQDSRSALPQIRLQSIVPLPDGSGPLFSPEEFRNPALLAPRIAHPDPSDEASQWLLERFSRSTTAALKELDLQTPGSANRNDAVLAALTEEMQGLIRTWMPKPDLLSSGPEDFDYVVEVDDSGIAHLRFGDGELGRAVEAGEAFFADYRTGNGSEGNIGANVIQHFVYAGAGKVPPAITPANPQPAQGGSAPESVEEVKLFAPGAFLTTLERAITADDYAAIAERNPKLQRAAADLFWTGTGYEAHVAIDPLGTDTVDESLIREVRDDLYRFRRIGHDLVVVPAQYVPLKLAMTVNVNPDYIAAHVRAALLDVFSDRALAAGGRGFFHPDQLSFGDNIYLSQLIAAAQTVAGVESVTVTRLERLDAGPNRELENGLLAIGPLEVAQLDNDPAFPERGQLTLTLRGGL